MNNSQNNSEAWTLANQTAGRYGRLALTRAAGEAAAAERKGDSETSALWSSVVAYLRSAMLQNERAVA